MSNQLKRIREAMKRSRAPAPARHVLEVIALHASPKDLLAFPGEDEIARITGKSERQVRRDIADLRKLGEVELVRRGIKGKSTNVYRVAILADDSDVIEDDDNRSPMSGSGVDETGHPCPVSQNRNPDMEGMRNRSWVSSRRDREEAPSLPASETDGEVRNIAEKREGLNLDVFPSNDPDIASGAVAGLLGDRAHERPEHLKSDPEFDQWLAEIRAANG